MMRKLHKIQMPVMCPGDCFKLSHLSSGSGVNLHVRGDVKMLATAVYREYLPTARQGTTNPETMHG